MAGPRIKCPRCGAELALTSVEKRGARRMIVCAHCDALIEWNIGDQHK